MTIPKTAWKVVVWLCFLGYLIYEVATDPYLFHGQFGQGLDFAVMCLGFVVVIAIVLYRPDALRRERKTPWWFWFAMFAWLTWFAFRHGLELWQSIQQLTLGSFVPLALFVVAWGATLLAVRRPRSKPSNDRSSGKDKSEG